MRREQVAADMWLVIHIPKTAGTSFRWALEKQFGQSQVVRDYGPEAIDTSEIVRKHLYEKPQSTGPAELIKEMSDGDSKVLIGHFPLQKYANYFKPENIISFVRDPLIRTCSEYLHRIGNASFSGSFSDYIQQPGSQAPQSWYLEGAPAQTIIGITDQYRESLGYINNVFDWKLKAGKKNVAWFKGGRKFAKNLSKKELDLFYDLNERDINFYQNAKQRFEANKISKNVFK
jgi:hypothetical protein